MRARPSRGAWRCRRRPLDRAVDAPVQHPRGDGLPQDLLGRLSAEALDRDVADASVGQRGAADVIGDHGVARDGDVQRLALAFDGEHDLAAARPADEPDGVGDGVALERLPVDANDAVAALQPGRLRRSAPHHAREEESLDVLGVVGNGPGGDPHDGLAPLLREALDKAGFVLAETIEVLNRSWHVDGAAVRPDHRMVGHTGFLIRTRKLELGVDKSKASPQSHQGH